MFRISGTSKTSGIAIAVAAVVDVIRGVNSVDPDILEKGMNSLRNQLSPIDYPEVVLACDSLAVGLSTQLPGLATAGIAAESDTDAPLLTSQVPCVIGLQDLLVSVGKSDLIIVDGNEGLVYVDPDTDTLARYQQLLGMYGPLKRIQIDDLTSPVIAPNGEIVLVYDTLQTSEDISAASVDCPDGYLMLQRSGSDLGYAEVLNKAAGKPTWVTLEKVTPGFLDSVEQYAAPGQVTAVFDPAGFDKGLIDITLATAASAGFKTGDYEIPWVSTGITTRGPELLEHFEVSHVLLMGGEWEEAVPEIPEVSIALQGKSADKVMVYLGSNLEMIPLAFSCGFRCISVDAGLARQAKELIKDIE